LYQEITRHSQYLHNSGEWEKRERLRLETELEALLQAVLVARWRQTISPELYQTVVDQLVERTISPWQAVADLLELKSAGEMP
jgi:putative protein kinase ArgK-like GTPase of G3E family